MKILKEKRDFLAKVGSNHVLLNQEIKFIPCGAWKIISNLPNFALSPRMGVAENMKLGLKHPCVLASSVWNQDFKGDLD